jgi:hypothetical protein
MTDGTGAPPDGLILRTLHLWFGFRDPVDRRAYLTSGAALMALKYGVDALVVYLTMKVVWLPSLTSAPSTRCGRRPSTTRPGGWSRA